MNNTYISVTRLKKTISEHEHDIEDMMFLRSLEKRYSREYRMYSMCIVRVKRVINQLKKIVWTLEN